MIIKASSQVYKQSYQYLNHGLEYMKHYQGNNATYSVLLSVAVYTIVTTILTDADQCKQCLE